MVFTLHVIVLLLIVLLLPTYGLPDVSKPNPQIQQAGAPSKPESNEPRDKGMETRLRELERRVETISVAKDFFSSILNTQTIIFSTIVVIILSITWIFSYLKVRSTVKFAVKDEFSKERTDFIAWRNNQVKKIQEVIRSQFESSKREAIGLWGELNRAFAQIHKDNPKTSYIWALRSAYRFNQIKEEPGTRIGLENARSALHQIKYPSTIEFDMDEITNILNSIDRKEYPIELKMIWGEIQRIYQEKTSFEEQ